MIFLVELSGKMIFLFPENMISFFRRKMKGDLSQKNAWKHDIFFKCPKKMVFQKKLTLEHDYLERLYLFFRKYDIFLWIENER